MITENNDNRLYWIDNLRATACLMVIMIHTTSFYVTHGLGVGEYNWLMANVLNSASRVSVPLFFMISGFLFFGERQAGKKHFCRIACCILFYSIISLIYMNYLTSINTVEALKDVFQKPIFFHLWFFYALIIIYLLSPLVRIKPVSAKGLICIVLLLGVLANPNTNVVNIGKVSVLPLNFYISGDAFYYVLYAMLGRAIGVMDIQEKFIPYAMGGIFLLAVALIALGTKRQLIINGEYAETYYIYCGPLVFIAAISLFIVFKQALTHPPALPLRLISHYSLGIYGFHAFFINFARTHNWDNKAYPMLDIPVLFAVTLVCSLLLAVGLGKIDRRHWVS
ncbi:acyltransferase [Sodalis ligni]|uniref:acyltransferase n=1 Tax=Sodalis ligni TaxID=2697027 RepID=UPI00193F9508|nr:acyltransferase [Sodalis ligni]QWA11304.1 acyltransferase [Sodalis ligni]